MERKINKVHIKANWYARIIEFMNKATFNNQFKVWYVESKYLKTWNKWAGGIPFYRPPAFIKENTTLNGIGKSYYIENELLQKCIQFWKENYEIKWWK
ncbi:hypothetical protein [Spiroplasma floricola]|uniref:Uncharacterized protein n=1 Tax=Spiroplasma floricola 23-6 TaxID=1336749 RepID=A0A2K8SF18_9MOLU|nr:hypothetical protein [Spiroplasma floricola]AUB32023.1 hypothetical protein SFLOR_v1c09750 [Spiroplasma floricola 23-6]